MCVCVRACVRACVHACARVRVHARAQCTPVGGGGGLPMYVCVLTLRMVLPGKILYCKNTVVILFVIVHILYVNLYMINRILKIRGGKRKIFQFISSLRLLLYWCNLLTCCYLDNHKISLMSLM